MKINFKTIMAIGVLVGLSGCVVAPAPVEYYSAPGPVHYHHEHYYYPEYYPGGYYHGWHRY